MLTQRYPTATTPKVPFLFVLDMELHLCVSYVAPNPGSWLSDVKSDFHFQNCSQVRFHCEVRKPCHYSKSFSQGRKIANEAPAAIPAHSHSSEWQQTTTVTQRWVDRDGWIDRRLHMRTRLLINSCWQRANTLGSLVEMSVMLAISLHAFQVGCPQPVTVGYQG